MHPTNQRYAYLQYGYAASESCFAIIFPSTHVALFFSRCSKKGGRSSTVEPRIPRSHCEFKDAENVA